MFLSEWLASEMENMSCTQQSERLTVCRDENRRIWWLYPGELHLKMYTPC